jgi:coenzyme F420 biosynthesis associated uncharacterized protein
MASGTLVDWGLAEAIAVRIAGDEAPRGRGRPFGPKAVADASEAAAAKVSAYTGLEAATPLPRAEAVDRARWARTGLVTLRDLSSRLEESLADGISLPGPLGSIVRGLAGRAAGAEAGAAVGFASRRVLGQYDIALGGSRRRPRLLLVEPNLAAAHSELGGEPEIFLEWVSLHETTHALQFGAVAWLRPHMSGLLDELIESGSAGLDTGALKSLARRLVTSDPRKTVRGILQGELATALVSGAQREVLGRLQTAMAVIEGYAEHVMDRAAPERETDFSVLRSGIDERRQGRGGLGEAVARMLGLELKMRQYRLGKAFCDAVEAQAGIDGLNGVWESPSALPTPSELEHPHEWLARRTAVAAA